MDDEEVAHYIGGRGVHDDETEPTHTPIPQKCAILELEEEETWFPILALIVLQFDCFKLFFLMHDLTPFTFHF